MQAGTITIIAIIITTGIVAITMTREAIMAGMIRVALIQVQAAGIIKAF
jgi:hypothetical protein